LVARDGGFTLLAAGTTSSTRLLTVTGLGLDGGVTAAPVSLALPPAYFPQLGAVSLGRRGGELVALSAYGSSAPEPLDLHAHVLGAGTPAPVVVSTSSAAQRGPFVSALGDEVVVGFTEARRPAVPDTVVQYVDQPWVARLAPSGALRSLDPQPVAVPPATTDGSSSVVGVTATASGWRVAWVDVVRNELWSVSLNGSTGALGTPVRHFTNVKAGALAALGTEVLVVGAGSSAATAQRLDAQGAPVGSAIALPMAFRQVGLQLSVAAGQGGWLVGGTSFISGSSTVTLQWVDAAGTLGPSLTRTLGTPLDVDRAPPLLAWNGTEWLVAVRESRCTVALERLSASLTSIGATPLYVAATCPRSLAVTPSFDGGWFIAHSEVDTGSAQLHLSTFSTTLMQLDDEVIASGRDLRSPALTRIAPATLGVAYVKLIDEAPFGVWRVRLQHWPQSPAPMPDAGTPDAGLVMDAGVTDAGVADAGVTDAGVTDAGVADAGVSDAGVTDAGVTDAGVTDAGVTDAGIADAGVTDAGVTDAGVTDAGSAVTADAGASDAGTEPPTKPSGCGCSSLSGEVVLFALGAMARRVRRRSTEHRS
jgi:hypothetical protein